MSWLSALRKQEEQMPKMKTHSGASKRFKVTANGNVKRGKAYHSHILTSKTKNRKRRLRHSDMVHPTDLRCVKRMLVEG